MVDGLTLLDLIFDREALGHDEESGFGRGLQVRSARPKVYSDPSVERI